MESCVAGILVVSGDQGMDVAGQAEQCLCSDAVIWYCWDNVASG